MLLILIIMHYNNLLLKNFYFNKSKIFFLYLLVMLSNLEGIIEGIIVDIIVDTVPDTFEEVIAYLEGEEEACIGSYFDYYKTF
jgi:hypothetical protein